MPLQALLRPGSPRLLIALAILTLAGCPSGNGSGDDDDVNLLEPIAPGALVMTEIQADPRANRPEWIELFNTTDAAITLGGCQIGTGGASSNQFVMTGAGAVPAGGYALIGAQEFLGEEGDASLATQAIWSGISINQNDNSEVVELACPDGSGARAITDRVAFDPTIGWAPRRGHTWQLRVPADAEANDDPANWCEAPIQPNTVYVTLGGVDEFGTPGGPTLCEQPGGETPSTEGDLIITEIAADPCTNTKEWFEVYNPGLEPLDARRCQIVDVPVDGSTEAAIHTIDAERGGTVVPPGGFLVLKSSSSTDPSLTITPDGGVLGDYPYANGISFKNDDNQYLSLSCPTEGGGTVEIDRVIYNWEDQGSGFKGRTLSLDPSAWNAEDNDNFRSWCLSPGDQYYAADECADIGTPGLANAACPVAPAFPGAGDVVFTELLALSDATVGNNEEWFEVKSVGAGIYGLDGCRIEVDDGATIDSHTINFALGVTIEPGEYLVLVKSSATDTIETCSLPYDYAYGTNISFSNSAAETLRLVCPAGAGDVVIDELPYRYVTNDPRGIAWQLDGASETAAANDEPANWCFPDPQGVTFPWTCSVTSGDTTGVNYGTPGTGGSCPSAGR